MRIQISGLCRYNTPWSWSCGVSDETIFETSTVYGYEIFYIYIIERFPYVFHISKKIAELASFHRTERHRDRTFFNEDPTVYRRQLPVNTLKLMRAC
jgi:hypothetical protein